MSDSAAVAGLVWDEWLPDSTKRLIAEAFDENRDDARTFVTWMAGVHDLGKASPAFAIQVEGLADGMREQGLAFPRFVNERTHAPHSVVSHILLEEWLVARHGWSKDIATSYAVIPGGHHGVPPSESALDDAKRRPEWLGISEPWSRVHAELAQFAADISGASSRLAAWGGRPLSVPVQVLTTAIVILSDWLASSEELFPFQQPQSSMVRAAEAWGRLQLPGAWHPDRGRHPFAPPGSTDVLFHARFTLPPSSEIRPVQRAAVQAAADMNEPGLLILEAPMGEGKTEAALAAAEVFAARTGAGGCIVALPTMATSDAMFARVHDWLSRVPDARGVNIDQTAFLAHGKSRLNEEYKALAKVGQLAAMGDDPENWLPPQRHPNGGTGAVVAHEWLSGRKKGVLANFVVGTIDQVLFGALKSKHLMLRHLALVNKIVIIDEVHAADVYMAVYLRRILSWLGAYRVPVILLSATLPSDARRALAEAYAEGSSRSVPLPEPVSFFDRKPRSKKRPGAGEADAENPFTDLATQEGYPIIATVTPSGEVAVETPAPSARRSNLRIELLPDDIASLATLLDTKLVDGGCVGIIRNTVKRAQETADELSQRFREVTVILAHSRFLSAHRIDNENRLHSLLGPPIVGQKSARPHKLIVVGTQVLEQSLDLDFDLMISDLAPLDLLLQRVGRLHRHVRDARPATVEAPCLVIAGVEDWATTPPQPVEASVYVYQLFPLLRALATLGDRLATCGPIALPDEIAPLVKSAYRSDYAIPKGWDDALSEAHAAWTNERVQKERKAETFLLGAVGRPGSSLIDWVNAGVGNVDDDSPEGQAQVRDTEDSIEVLVVQEIAGELRVMPDIGSYGGSFVATEQEPPWGVALAVASCSIRLPPRLCQRWRVDRTIGALEQNAFAGWQQSPLLKGQLVLVLDENLEAEVDGSTLRYSRARGLEIDEPLKESIT